MKYLAMTVLIAVSAGFFQATLGVAVEAAVHELVTHALAPAQGAAYCAFSTAGGHAD